LNLFKAFKNQRSWPWLAFKSGRRYAAGFSQENCSLKTYLAGLNISEIGLGWLSKALSSPLRNLLSNRSKGLELAGFQKLWTN
jgi:hypothetical protein